MDRLRLGMDRAFIDGAKIVNESFSRPSALALRKGSNEAMDVYRNNKKSLERMESEYQMNMATMFVDYKKSKRK
jgi:hypothetical protein